MKRIVIGALLACAGLGVGVGAISVPSRSKAGIVSSQSEIASKIGADVIRDGGTRSMRWSPRALRSRSRTRRPATSAEAASSSTARPTAKLLPTISARPRPPRRPRRCGRPVANDPQLHHNSYLAVGVPGTVAGLHLAWRDQGKLPWRRLVEPAIALARDGFVVSDGLARSLKGVQRSMAKYPASVAAYTKNGVPYMKRARCSSSRTWLRRSSALPPMVPRVSTKVKRPRSSKEMLANGGIITKDDDLRNYKAKRRTPVKGTYRGYEIIAMPPPTSGGVTMIEALNILEGYDLAKWGPNSADTVHVMAEAMKRAYSERAQFLGDPDFNTNMPIERLISKAHADELRKTISLKRAAASAPAKFEWPHESDETTQVSIVDGNHNAASMTYTLEQGYGVKIVVPGAGFLLNNEMGDFNAAPGLTTKEGLIGTEPNLTVPGEAHAVEHGADDSREGRRAVHGHRQSGWPHHHQHDARDDCGRRRLQAERAGSGRCPRFHHQWLPTRSTTSAPASRPTRSANSKSAVTC